MPTFNTDLMTCHAENIRSVTCHYVAPELVKWDKDDKITNKVDIYSAGATLNELVPLFYLQQTDSDEYGIGEGVTNISNGSRCCNENHRKYDGSRCTRSH